MYTGLIIGVVGLLIWAACSRLELASLASDVFFSAEHKARDEMTRSEGAAHRHERSLAHQAIGFFKSVGIGPAAIGFGGAPIYTLVLMTSFGGVAILASGGACTAVSDARGLRVPGVSAREPANSIYRYFRHFRQTAW